MLKKSVAALILCFAIASCATPAGVPRGAGVDLNPIEGPIWSWRRTVAHGCVYWSATQGWAVAQLSADPAQCEGGPGLSYHTSADYLVFQNYLPSPQGDPTDRLTFDSNGRPTGWRQCPYSLSVAQLETLRAVAREVLARATTDAERRALNRIDQLLAATNGASLMDGQGGCTGRTSARSGPNGSTEDTWTNTGTAVVPCDSLPAGAVATVPAPFDQYMQLVCTRSGQALRPVDGSQWIFSTGPRWIWSVNPRPPSPTDHYVRLTSDPIDEAQLATLRSELAEVARFFPGASGYTSEPPLSDRTIIRLSVQKSWGGRTQVYLLIPPEGAGDQHVLGVECIRDCRAMRNDASFFAIAPSH